MTVFTGAGTALVTPFAKDGKIDFPAFERLIRFQIEKKADALIVCGCTGEAATLTDQERMECVRIAVDLSAGRIPVIAGTGSNVTETAVSLSERAQRAGADAILVITPYYNKCTQSGLINHYRKIAARVDIPMMLYNVPSRTGVNLLPQTVMALADECDNIIAIKEASGNISQIADLAAISQGRMDIYSGNDDMIVPMLSLGAKGVISVVSNILPTMTHNMVRAFQNGQTKKAADLQLQLLPLIRALFCEVNPIPVKAALSYLGMCENVLREPLTALESQHIQLLKTALKELEVIN